MINIKIESTSKRDNEAAELIAQAITYVLNDEFDCEVRSKHDSYMGDDVYFGCSHEYSYKEDFYGDHDEITHRKVYKVGKVRLKT